MPKDGKGEPDLLAALERHEHPADQGGPRTPPSAACRRSSCQKALALPFGSLTKVQATRANVDGFIPFRIPRICQRLADSN